MRVSVVVTTKDRLKLLERALVSIYKQSRFAGEIIVVDGNSTDRTREIVKRFPVKLVTAPLEDTYGISRNLGVNCAEGEIILFLDAEGNVLRHPIGFRSAETFLAEMDSVLMMIKNS